MGLIEQDRVIGVPLLLLGNSENSDAKGEHLTLAENLVTTRIATHTPHVLLCSH